MTKIFVPDDMLGKIGTKQWEVYRRVKDGSLEPNYVLDSLQKIIEGDQFLHRPWAFSALRMEETEVDQNSHRVILSLQGSLEIGESSVNFNRKIKDLIKRGQNNIILDCHRLTYMDGSGIGYLTSAFKSAHDSGGRLCLLSLTVKIQDLLAITKLLTVFDTYNDEMSAIRSFSESKRDS